MPYITQIHVKRCRNVHDLDIDLSLPGPDDLAPPVAPSEARAFRHLILTGPNGSGKSGILEGMEDCLVFALFSGEARDRIRKQSDQRRRSPLDASSPTHPGDIQLHVQQGGPYLGLDWDTSPPAVREAFERNEMIAVCLPSKRHVGRQDVRGPRAIELLLRMEAVQRARGDYTFEPSGVVVVDEIETHLHLALQEQILPFLTELFPRLQFVIATHSPAVIASVPGAVVCDLVTREQALSEHYRGIPYGILMKEHFGISSDIDLDSTHKLLRLRELCALRARSDDAERELRALAAELTQRSPVLATEVWMVMEGFGGSSVQVGEGRS